MIHSPEQKHFVIYAAWDSNEMLMVHSILWLFIEIIKPLKGFRINFYVHHSLFTKTLM